MLHKKLSIKAHTLGIVISLTLAIIAFVIVLIIFSGKVELTKATCERREGSCVTAEQCGTCSGTIDCESKYPYSCEGDFICCPSENVI